MLKQYSQRNLPLKRAKKIKWNKMKAMNWLDIEKKTISLMFSKYNQIIEQLNVQTLVMSNIFLAVKAQ